MDNSPISPTDAAVDADVVPIIEIDDGPEEPETPLTKNEPEAELSRILSPAPDMEDGLLTVNKSVDLAAIRRHDDKFAEIDNEMDDTKHAQSLRKSGL
ncbi:hypothetical protein HDU89_003944 [Geranomyces variabilis]|nr:hypothetical protein HDU89_003944 [Geranomyces variabilis]